MTKIRELASAALELNAYTTIRELTIRELETFQSSILRFNQLFDWVDATTGMFTIDSSCPPIRQLLKVSQQGTHSLYLSLFSACPPTDWIRRVAVDRNATIAGLTKLGTTVFHVLGKREPFKREEDDLKR
jgi:hypothetical protein